MTRKYDSRSLAAVCNSDDLAFFPAVHLNARECDRAPIRCYSEAADGEAGVGMAGVLGFTYLDRSPSRSWLATVFGDRIIALADRTRLPREVLIGRAMAHELGHVLLETSAHATHGFMQPVWSDAILLQARPSDWLFTPREAAQMRARAVVRSRGLTNDLLARRDR